MGAALAGEPRDDFVLATKVGRLVVPTDRLTPADDVDHQALDGRDDAFYADTAGRHVVFDYSAEGVRRSIADSLERLGLDRIDVAWIHDPDAHWEAAIGGAYPELHRLREQGVVRAIGVGMNQSAMPARFVRETDIDAVLLAGRYTLLDQDALADLLPACVERGVVVLAAGVMNSGVLADPRPGVAFDYAPAPPDVVDAPRTSPRPASATACRSAPRRCSSRWPTRPSWASSPASGRRPTSTSTRRCSVARSRRRCGTSCARAA